ncbi:MAG: hypothetical protein HOU81_15740 [Hamadaea sp.]|uniref:hypothetical protein n=1 Tax=Hamadaea sp. TaxID=2024425 RepID=UPI001792D0BA|nr:hypothetical protein [Hamadaea sp.]NUR72265.1 hypothetical protein [Hamadaea sp.]NUT23221.1 hypothetical protein [Hamadaea sp.]
MTNPLVAQTQSSTTWYTGLGLIEDVAQISDGISNDSWVDGTLGTVGGALDVVGLVVDPLGSLVAWGVSWLMEHVKPLKEALDWLAGNPDEISAHAQTWENVAKHVLDAQKYYADAVRIETAGWVGPSGDAYRQHAGTQLTVLEGISKGAHGIHYAVMGAGLIVGLVRGIVRDLIAQFVGTLAARLPQWLAEAGLTLGLATPVVIGQVVSLVTTWVNKIQKFVRALLSSLKKLIPMVKKLGEILDQLKALLSKLSRSNPLTRNADDLPGGRPARLANEDFDPATWEPTVQHRPGATAIGNDPNTLNAYSYIQTEDGVHQVVIHGRPSGFPHDMTPAEVAAIIKSNPDYVPGTPVRMVTCYGGNMNMAMAAELKTTVHGYNQTLIVNPDGSFVSGGQWQTFDWEKDSWMLD